MHLHGQPLKPDYCIHLLKGKGKCVQPTKLKTLCFSELTIHKKLCPHEGSLRFLICNNLVSSMFHKHLSSRGHAIFWSLPELIPHTIWAGRGLRGTLDEAREPYLVNGQSHFLKAGGFGACFWAVYRSRFTSMRSRGWFSGLRGKTQCPSSFTATPQPQAALNECLRPSFTFYTPQTPICQPAS